MAITKDDVKYIAKLAKLRFNDEEAEAFAGEFENILEQFKTLDKLNLDVDEIVDMKMAMNEKKYSIDKCNQ